MRYNKCHKIFRMKKRSWLTFSAVLNLTHQRNADAFADIGKLADVLRLLIFPENRPFIFTDLANKKTAVHRTNKILCLSFLQDTGPNRGTLIGRFYHTRESNLF